MTQKKYRLFSKSTDVLVVNEALIAVFPTFFHITGAKGKCHIFKVHSDEPMRLPLARGDEPWGFAICPGDWTNQYLDIHPSSLVCPGHWLKTLLWKTHCWQIFSGFGTTKGYVFLRLTLTMSFTAIHGTAKANSVEAIPSEAQRLWPRYLDLWLSG